MGTCLHMIMCVGIEIEKENGNSFVEGNVFVSVECVLSVKSRDRVYIVQSCMPTILHTYVRDQKPSCKHSLLLCNSTFLKRISTFSPSFVAPAHEAFSLLLSDKTTQRRTDEIIDQRATK